MHHWKGNGTPKMKVNPTQVSDQMKHHADILRLWPECVFYLSPERRHAREQEVGHHTHRPHVWTEAGPLSVHHLRRHELWLPVIQFHVAWD